MDDKLLLGLVAGCSAVGGVLLTQVFITLRERFNIKKAHRVLLRKRYETLIDKVTESVAHRIKMVNHTNDDFFAEGLNMPLEKALNLSLLYFPELIEPTKSYRKAYLEYYMVLANTFIPDDVLTVAMQAASEAGGELDSSLGALNQAEKKLYKCIQENSLTYTKA